jgi:uncharacterized protein YybS (DUF2232 family)
MPDWNTLEKYFSIIGVAALMVFPIVSGIPILGYFVQIAALVAVIYLSYRNRYILLGLGAIGSIVSSSLVFGFSMVLLGIWAGTVLTGAVFGRLLTSGVLPGKAFLVAVLVSSTISFLLFWFERDLIFSALDEANRWILTGLTSGSGLAPAEADRMTDWANTMIALVKRLIPSMMALSGALQLFFGWLCLVILLKGLGEFVPSFGNFITWKMPYYYIYISGAILLSRLLGTEPMKIIADNFLLFLGFFYAVFGFSVFEFYLKKIRLSPLLRAFFYVGLIFLQLPGLILAAAVGFLDSYFDFRKIRARIIG